MKGIISNFNFGLRVKELLDERGISTADFLKQTGFPNQRFYDWCNKGSMPSVLSALRVAEFFNMSVEQFVYGKTSDKLAEYVEVLQRKLNNIKEIVS